jgi:hypothetical protein
MGSPDDLLAHQLLARYQVEIGHISAQNWFWEHDDEHAFPVMTMCVSASRPMAAPHRCRVLPVSGPLLETDRATL